MKKWKLQTFAVNGFIEINDLTDSKETSVPVKHLIPQTYYEWSKQFVKQKKSMRPNCDIIKVR